MATKKSQAKPETVETIKGSTASGWSGKAQGKQGNALFLVYRDPDTSEILHAWAGIAGRDGIKPDTWYQLDANGQPAEVQP